MSKRVSDRCSGGQLEPGKTGARVRWLGDISFLVSRGDFPFDLCFQRITISCWNGLLPTIATATINGPFSMAMLNNQRVMAYGET